VKINQEASASCADDPPLKQFRGDMFSVTRIEPVLKVITFTQVPWLPIYRNDVNSRTRRNSGNAEPAERPRAVLVHDCGANFVAMMRSIGKNSAVASAFWDYPPNVVEQHVAKLPLHGAILFCFAPILNCSLQKERADRALPN